MSERSSSPDPVHGGEGEPAEITRIKRELKSASEETGEAGDWLGSAMEASWGVAEALLKYPEVADLLSERHRIISRVYRGIDRR